MKALNIRTNGMIDPEPHLLINAVKTRKEIRVRKVERFTEVEEHCWSC